MNDETKQKKSTHKSTRVDKVKHLQRKRSAQHILVCEKFRIWVMFRSVRHFICGCHPFKSNLRQTHQRNKRFNARAMRSQFSLALRFVCFKIKYYFFACKTIYSCFHYSPKALKLRQNIMNFIERSPARRKWRWQMMWWRKIAFRMGEWIFSFVHRSQWVKFEHGYLFAIFHATRANDDATNW